MGLIDDRLLAAPRLDPVVPPLALARIGGLPVEALADVHDADAVAWVLDVLAQERRVHFLAATVSAVLHRLVTDNRDREQRRWLVNLRRGVFNDRPPATIAADVRRLGTVDATAGAAATAWHEAWCTLAQLRAAGDAIVAADVARSRSALARWAATPELRSGLLLASPALAARADELGRPGGGRPDRARRKVERSVLSYLTRAALKPSPFSTFTPVQLARFEPHGAATDQLPIGSKTHSRVQLNVAVLNRVRRLVLDDPAKRADLPLAATTGWAREEDRIRFVRRWVASGDERRAVTFDAVTDGLFFVRDTDTVTELLQLLQDAADAPTFQTVAAWLAVRYDAELADAERYLSLLLDVGLLEVPGFAVAAHHPDPVAALSAFLRGLRTFRPDGGPGPVAWAGALADRLCGAAAVLDAYPTADVGARVPLLARLRSVLERAFAEICEGAEEKVPRTLLYEDVVAGERPLALDAGRWDAAVLEPLRHVEPVLRAWDVALPQRLTFLAYFVARFGVGGRADDVLGLFHDFAEDFFEQYQSVAARRDPFVDGCYQPEVNWLGSAALERLDAARRVLTDGLRAAYAGNERAEEVVIGRHVVAAVAEHTDLLPFGDEPRSHLVQLARRGVAGPPLVVLNQVYGGLHFPFSRFASALEGVGLPAILRERTAAAVGADVVLAEVTGGAVTSNLNLHARILEDEIVCPGERSSLPAARQVALDDLVAVHVPEEGRVVLWSRRRGAEVQPAYLGYLVPVALPAVPRSLLLLAAGSSTRYDPWAGVPPGPEQAGVGYRPRVTCAGVVLQRRCWQVAVGDLPRAGAAPAGDAERLLAWNRWRSSHGIPERVFATVRGRPGASGASSSKPGYVDFGSVLALHAFEALLAPQAHVQLAEVLPDLDSAIGLSAAGSHVVELAVEHRPRPSRQPSPRQRSER